MPLLWPNTPSQRDSVASEGMSAMVPESGQFAHPYTLLSCVRVNTCQVCKGFRPSCRHFLLDGSPITGQGAACCRSGAL